MKLLFEEYVKENKTAFIAEVNSVSVRLGINPNWLMAVMWIETAYTFSPSIQNARTRATGLIQFMPQTANSLNTSVEHLKMLTNVQQLRYVERYYKPYRHYLKSYPDLYLATFFPLALKKGDDYIFQNLPNLPAWLIAKQNGGVDLNSDGKITKAEFYEYCYKKLPLYAAVELKKKA